MTPQDFEYLRRLLRERSGLSLSADKHYLLESRLLPIARQAGVVGLSQLTQLLRAPRAEALIIEVVEAMTTNETYFFRDKAPFDHFRDTMLPSLLIARASQRRIRIWCAACSTGQEPYSLAMMLAEMGAKLAGWRIEILGTDISTEVIAKAKAGIYTQFEVQRGLPIQMLVKHFSQTGDRWRLSQAIRNMVQLRPLNLLRDFGNLGKFDVLFCRNVLIYFDQAAKGPMLDRLAQVVAPDGFLVLGAAETVVGLTGAFKPHAERRGLYTLLPSLGAAPRTALEAPRLVGGATV